MDRFAQAMGMLMIVFYFFMIRPERKRATDCSSKKTSDIGFSCASTSVWKLVMSTMSP